MTTKGGFKSKANVIGQHKAALSNLIESNIAGALTTGPSGAA